jgi:hypothetical protein
MSLGQLSVELIAESLIFGSVQYSLASCLMSSVFSVRNFSKDQQTLNNAVGALCEFLKVAIVWFAITSALMYYSHGTKGFVVTFILTLVIVGWLTWIYEKAFREAACKNHLHKPSIWKCLVDSDCLLDKKSHQKC